MPPDSALRTFRGLAHATYEIVQGTAQFLSHKRSLGVVKGQTPYFDPLLAGFYKDAFGIQTLALEELKKSASVSSTSTAESGLKAWVDGLKKDTSFVLFAEDHPVTGELFDWEPLDQMLNEKKIFSFRISHFQHFYNKFIGVAGVNSINTTTPLRPYSVQLCFLNPDLAVAKCGERFKVPPLLAPSMDWDVEKTVLQVEKIQVSTQEQKQVQKFEESFSDIAEPWFELGTSTRLFDRVVLNFKDISGEALLHALQDRLQMDPSQYFETIDTTNLCRWHHYKTFSTWWEPKPSEADLQGLLVIDSGWLVTKDFAKILRQVCEEIRAQQSW